ncbi:MAG: hypothetical protein ACLU0O_04825 [Collinsella sp.]
MIYTLTANPAIDYNIACDGLTANTVTRTRNAVYTPNGKGLNVSFTLDHYGVDTTILVSSPASRVSLSLGRRGPGRARQARVDRRYYARQCVPQRRSRHRVQHGQCRCRHQ